MVIMMENFSPILWGQWDTTGFPGRTCMFKLTYFLFYHPIWTFSHVTVWMWNVSYGAHVFEHVFQVGGAVLRVCCATLGQGLGASPRSLGVGLGDKTCSHFLPEPFASWSWDVRKPLLTPLIHFITLCPYCDGLHALIHGPDKSFLLKLFLLAVTVLRSVPECPPTWRAVHTHTYKHTCCGILF